MEITKENIQPLKNFILVEPKQRPQETSSGFVMPEEGYTPTPVVGTVIAVGPDSQFVVGDIVFFRRFAVDELKFNTSSGTQEIVSMISDDEIVGKIIQKNA